MPITVIRDQTQPMRHIVHVRNHLLPADVSVEEGGLDAGPSPHDLYDAALGACKALTVAWYARRKNSPVEDISVSVEKDDSEERQGVYKLNAIMHFGGDLTDAQRQELLAAAAKCPLHKLMSTVKTDITTTLG